MRDPERLVAESPQLGPEGQPDLRHEGGDARPVVKLRPVDRHAGVMTDDAETDRVHECASDCSRQCVQEGRARLHMR